MHRILPGLLLSFAVNFAIADSAEAKGSRSGRSSSHSTSTANPSGSHYVHGYTRRDGTHVAPHLAHNPTHVGTGTARITSTRNGSGTNYRSSLRNSNTPIEPSDALTSGQPDPMFGAGPTGTRQAVGTGPRAQQLAPRCTAYTYAEYLKQQKICDEDVRPN